MFILIHHFIQQGTVFTRVTYYRDLTVGNLILDEHLEISLLANRPGWFVIRCFGQFYVTFGCVYVGVK